MTPRPTRSRNRDGGETTRQRPRSALARAVAAPRALLFHVGFFTLVLQSLLVREFLYLYHGSEIALGVFYAAWLVWMGVGAAAALPLTGRLGRHDGSGAGHARALGFPTSEAVLTWGLALIPAAAFGEVALLRLLRAASGVPTAELTPLGVAAIGSFCATALVGIPAGALFTVACRAAASAPTRRAAPFTEEAGELFGWEALGGCVGGLTHAFLLAGRLDTDATLWLLAALAGAHVLALTVCGARGPGRMLTAAVGLAWLMAGIAAIATPAGKARLERADARRFERQHPGLEWAAACESRYQRLELARRDIDGETFHALFVNGGVAFTFPDRTDARRDAALAVSQLPGGPKRVLVLGGAADGSLVAELLRYACVERIDLVSLDPAIPDLLRDFLDPEAREALENPKVHTHYIDPRAFVNDPPADTVYDLVLVEAPDPLGAVANRLYTLQFYEAARKLMPDDGVLVTSVLTSVNYMGADIRAYAGAMIGSVRAVFGHIALAPGDRATVMASPSAVVSADPAELARRYRALVTNGEAFDPRAFDTLLPERETREIRERFSDIDAPLNTDQRPVAYYLATILWSRFSGSHGAAALLRAVREAGPVAFAAPLLLLWLARLLYVAFGVKARAGGATGATPGAGDPFNAFTTVLLGGFAGMGLSLTMLLAYQSSEGLVYGRIGLLAALFMAGLGVGAVAVHVTLSSRPALRARSLLIGALVAFALLLLAAWGVLTAGGVSGAAAMALLGAGGCLSGAVFAASAQVHGGRRGEAGGWLNGADNAGGALGALVTGAFIAPLAGLGATPLVASLLVLGLGGLNLQARFLERRGTAAAPRGAAPRDVDRFRPWLWLLATLVIAGYIVGPRVALKATQGPGESGREASPRLSLEEVRRWTEVEEWRFDQDPFPHWSAEEMTAEGRPREIVLTTDQAGARVVGYGGALTLAVRMDADRVIDVLLLEHRETPAYVRGLQTWLRAFEGEGWREGFPPGKPIDALTGATVSCRAAAETIQQASGRAGREIFGVETAPRDAAGRASWRTALLAPESLVLMAALLLVGPVSLLAGDRRRVAFLALSVVVMGFWLNRVVTVLDLSALGLGRLPGPGNASALVLLVGVGVTSVLWGSVFCGYLCPFGALQELAARLADPGGSRRARLGEGLRRWRALRYVLSALALGGVGLTAGSVSGFAAWSPLQTFFAAHKTPLLWASGLAALAGSLAVPRLFCLYLCPAGAVLGLFNRMALLRGTRLARQPDYGACDLGAAATRPRDCLMCHRCRIMARPRAEGVGRGRAVAAAAMLVLVALLCVTVALRETPRAPGGPGVGAAGAGNAGEAAEAVRPPGPALERQRERARDVDARAIEDAIRSGRLSDHEALFYAPLGPGGEDHSTSSTERGR